MSDYKAEVVAKILAAAKARPIAVLTGTRQFLEWLRKIECKPQSLESKPLSRKKKGR